MPGSTQSLPETGRGWEGEGEGGETRGPDAGSPLQPARRATLQAPRAPTEGAGRGILPDAAQP